MNSGLITIGKTASKKTKEKEVPEEFEEREKSVQRISARSKKIKKLGDEYDTSDWRKGRSTRNGRVINAPKKNLAEKKRGNC